VALGHGVLVAGLEVALLVQGSGLGGAGVGRRELGVEVVLVGVLGLGVLEVLVGEFVRW